MTHPSPRRLWKYVTTCLKLKDYLAAPGDGRTQPQIAATSLRWSLLMGCLLRDRSVHAIEALVRSSARWALRVRRSFGDDALAYLTERLDPSRTRAAAGRAIRCAKRNKAFAESRFIGLALDGTTAGRSREQRCELCRPARTAAGEITGSRHQCVAISIVGTGLSLPFDVEPYGPGDSEYAAGQRVVTRAVRILGVRFADYAVVDGEFATAPFLHAAGDCGLYAVARLKGNVPELFAAAQHRFGPQAPHAVFEDGHDRVEVWDADDCDPWATLRWHTGRVLRDRQHKPDGTIIDACWLTDFPSAVVGSRSLYRIATGRWEIENQGFNDAKNRYGLAHICHHTPNSMLIGWLLTFLAMTIERLYRIRYLRRGTHPIRPAVELARLLWLSLSRPVPSASG